MTAAHRTLPFETWVRVEDLENGKSVDVRINDRGPFIDGRVIDLSQAAAREMGLLGPGLARVRVEVIDPPDAETIAASHSLAPLPVTSSRNHTPVPSARAISPASIPPPITFETTNDAPPTRSSADASASSLAVTPAPTNVLSLNAIGPPASEWFAVQVGIFANRDQGEQTASQMAKLFGDARVILADDRAANAPSWRVIVGRQMPLDQATALLRKMWRDPSSSPLASTAEVVAEPSKN